jgi:hypothetical protein
MSSRTGDNITDASLNVKRILNYCIVVLFEHINDDDICTPTRFPYSIDFDIIGHDQSPARKGLVMLNLLYYSFLKTYMILFYNLTYLMFCHLCPPRSHSHYLVNIRDVYISISG